MRQNVSSKVQIRARNFCVAEHPQIFKLWRIWVRKWCRPHSTSRQFCTASTGFGKQLSQVTVSNSTCICIRRKQRHSQCAQPYSNRSPCVFKCLLQMSHRSCPSVVSQVGSSMRRGPAADILLSPSRVRVLSTAQSTECSDRRYRSES